MATGSIFDSPWFALERPAFEKMVALGDTTLTILLLIGAVIVIWLALSPKTPTLLKAVVLAYITLP